MSIDRIKIEEAIELCRKFLQQVSATLHQLQSMIGKLFHVSKCTLGARAFLLRLLDFLRQAWGGGGISEGYGFYSIEYPDYIRQWGFCIASLECLNLLFAIRIWAQAWKGLNVLYWDNMATVCATSSARAEDPLIRGALRELWWWSATGDFQLTVRHKPGSEMSVPDMISRAHVNEAGKQKFAEFLTETKEQQILVDSTRLMPPIPL